MVQVNHVVERKVGINNQTETQSSVLYMLQMCYVTEQPKKIKASQPRLHLNLQPPPVPHSTAGGD